LRHPEGVPRESVENPTGAADERWRAVVRRDRQADGRFVYAVESTGIYCRPTCPSRRPRRDRVVFFESPDAAEASGYRACRRCRPRDLAPTSPWPARIEQACRYLAEAGATVPLAHLARRVGVSPFHLQRTFKRIVGLTPRQYADACRLARAKRSLRQGEGVTRAIVEAGYGSNSRFYERAARLLAMAPSTYGKGGAGLVIRYAIVDSPLGSLLVAATPRGVCSVAMGSSAGDVKQRLAREYPAAALTAAADRTLVGWTRRVVARLEGTEPHADLPLDVRATAFQWRVWNALSAIPPGETRTYAEIAASIGSRRSARAVGQACAANPVAIAIPCHRAVPASGGVGGYRWGAARKKALLAHEAGGRMPAR
jgi:AraC family transcriptional regulator of adaptative response/methylated-DNA-[protein]-cysteine methyltransferase